MRRASLLVLLVLIVECTPVQPPPSGTPVQVVTETEPPKDLPPSAIITPPEPPLQPLPTPTLMPATGDVTFEALAQVGGTLNSIAVNEEGTIAYVGIGPRVATFDISDLTAPTLLGQSEVLAGVVDGIVLQDDRIYAAAGATIVRLDRNNATAPVVSASVEMPGAVEAMVLDGDVLFAGGVISWRCTATNGCTGEGFAASVWTSDMQLLDEVHVPGWISAMAAGHGALYFGGLYQEGVLYRVDAGDPAHLGDIEVHDLGPNVPVHGLRVYGDHLIVGSYGIYAAYDISNQLERVWKSREDNDLEPTVWGTSSFALYAGNLVGTGLVPAGGYIPARDSMPVPDFIRGEALPVSSEMTIVRDTLLAVENYQLNAFRVSDLLPGELAGRGLAPIGQYVIPLPPVDNLIAYDGTLYADSATEYLPLPGSLMSFSIPELDLVGQYRLPELSVDGEYQPEFLGLDAADGRIYLTGTDRRLYILRADPRNLSLLGSSEHPGGYFERAAPVASGQVVYVITATSTPTDWLEAADFSDPNTWVTVDTLKSPRLLGVLAGSEQVLAVATRANIEDENRIYLMPLDGSKLNIVDTIKTTAPVADIAIRDGLLVAVEANRLTLISVADPNAPREMAAIPLPASAAAVALSNNLAFVLSSGPSESSLLAFDISNPANLVLAGRQMLPPMGGDTLAVVNDTVVVGGSSMGIYAFRYRQALQ